VTHRMKMTDAALLDLAYTLASTKHPWAMQYVEAIRSLRDAAQEVVNHAEDNSCMECCHEYKVLLSGETVKNLSALLPKEPQ